MRTRIILSMAMAIGMACLPLAAAKKLRPSWMIVKLDGDANGAVVTGISPDANAPVAVETKTISLTVKVDGDANGAVVTGISPGANGAAVAIRPDWGYVGIQVTPVLAAVASQLRLKDRGVMIRNVAKGSPADKAGLDRYDVIVMIGKDKPVKNVVQFIQAVRKCKPGEALALTTLRGGKQKVIDLTPGKRPTGEIEYVYEEYLEGGVLGMSILRGIRPMAQADAEANAAVAEIQAAAEKLQKEIEQHIRELTERTRQEAQAARGIIARAVAPVSRQFDVDEKGRIQVRILKDGSELNITFAGQAEMKKKSPKLYEEYMKLLDSDQAGQ